MQDEVLDIAGSNTVVTTADLASERLILEGLRRPHPRHIDPLLTADPGRPKRQVRGEGRPLAPECVRQVQTRLDNLIDRIGCGQRAADASSGQAGRPERRAERPVSGHNSTEFRSRWRSGMTKAGFASLLRPA
jgi:hypothetical protein